MLEAKQVVFVDQDKANIEKAVQDVVFADLEIPSALKEECLEGLFRVASPKAVTLSTDTVVCNGVTTVLGVPFVSKTLSMHLKDCSSCHLMAVTIGAEVDRLIAKSSNLSTAKGYVIDKIASIYVEAVADCVTARLMGQGRGHLTQRYSVGYGDFDIKNQSFFIEILDTSKKIGLTMTSGFMLAPTKSITAIVGVADTPQPKGYPCDNCKQNCKGGLCTR